jgi:hypothetical protein
MSLRKSAPERAPTSWPITPVLRAARDEAGLARHGYVGVEHLFVALTRDHTTAVTQLLANHRVTHPQARDAVWLVVGSGRGDGPRWDAQALLRTLGIDLGEIRRQVELQLGPDAIDRLYSGPVGWNLRPRGPLCDLGLSPVLKRAVDSALGDCWGNAPPQLHERLLLGALDVNSDGLAAVLGELGVSAAVLRAEVEAELRIAS